jgi:hypothetical protein
MKRDNNEWERISAWTLRVMIAMAIILAFFIITGKIDLWLGLN